MTEKIAPKPDESPKLKQIIEELQDTLRETALKAATRKKAISALKQEIKAFETSQTKERKVIDSLSIDNQELQTRADDLEKKRARIAAECQQLKDKLKSQSDEHSQLTNKLKAALQTKSE
jgi:chromosome segregation ATPase